MPDPPIQTAHAIIRGVVDACADCDTCRFLMDESCLLFPELYRLYDKQRAEGRQACEAELRRLPEFCTLCGLCPCPDIRADVIRSKTERVRKEGLPLGFRLLADVQRFSRWGGMMPRLVNAILNVALISRAIKRIARIHPQRRLPTIPQEIFFVWARKKGLDRESHRNPKVVYFAGCTAGYFFPEVARATVSVLEHNSIAVFVPPEQQCCGMPTLLEGDRRTTLDRVRANLQVLLNAVSDGCEVICSCPTCGYLLKVLLTERAVFSDAYQRSVAAGDDEIKVPGASDQVSGFASLKKSIYRTLLKDDGYFAGIDPLARIALSRQVEDAGRYLGRLHREKRLKTDFGRVEGRMVYFAPCHQREQGSSSPYEELLRLIPGLSVQRVGGAMDCCGMGGSLGFKEGFHGASLQLGHALMQKIAAVSPEAIVTDCLSCRLQFKHALPYPVLHPLELIQSAYNAAKAGYVKPAPAGNRS